MTTLSQGEAAVTAKSGDLRARIQVVVPQVIIPQPKPAPFPCSIDGRILDRAYLQLRAGRTRENARELAKFRGGRVTGELNIHPSEPGLIIALPCPEGDDGERLRRTERILKQLRSDPRVTIAMNDQISDAVPKNRGRGAPPADGPR